MQQRQQRTKKGRVKASVCFTCSHACDGRRCGWADTLKTENLPEGAEFIISHRKTYLGKDKIYYQIKSCPKHEKGYTNTPPQETNALKLAETMLYKLSKAMKRHYAKMTRSSYMTMRYLSGKTGYGAYCFRQDTQTVPPKIV